MRVSPWQKFNYVHLLDLALKGKCPSLYSWTEQQSILTGALSVWEMGPCVSVSEPASGDVQVSLATLRLMEEKTSVDV